MSSVRYCKCHYLDGQSEHWGILDRKSFMPKSAPAHFTPDMPLQPRHLILDLSFDWEKERVWGSTTHQFNVKGHAVNEIELDAVNLDVSRVLIGKRSVEFENTGKKIIIPGKQVFKQGSRVAVTLYHSVTQPQAGIYFTKPDSLYPDRFQTVWTQGQDEDSRYYFPCLDKPNFKQTTEVILHLPPGLFGLSNGRLVRKKHTASESLYHYKLDIPYSTYLLSIVAGEFAEHKDRWGDVEIKWYVQKGREREGRNAFRDTARIIKFFSEYTGYRYPYKHYTQIAVPEFIFGGMENFTVTTQSDLTLHDDRAALDIDSNGLVAHEAAHTWFGNILTAKSWAHAWLHESFATYFDALYTRESKSEEEFRYQLLEDAETYFSEDAQYRRPIVTHVYNEPIDLFDAHLYPGGAVRLHHLKSIAGEKFFRQALKIFLERHQFGLVETVDFIRCIEEVLSKNFDHWLDQWIYRGGYPSLDVSFHWEAKFQMAVVEIKQTQKAEKKGEELLFQLPLKIGFYHNRTEEVFPLEIKNKQEKFCFKLKAKPLYFRLDPDYQCPCKKVKLEAPRPMLYAQLEKDQDPIGRIQAAQALVSKPSEKDIKTLCSQLRKEKFWGVSNRIASALGKIGGKQARDGLLKGLKNDHPKIRYGIVKALGQFLHDEKAAAALRKAAEGDASYRVEAAAFQALGKIKEKKLRVFLESSLDRPSHNDMGRLAIFQALAELEDEASWDAIVQGAKYGAPKNSRMAAMRSMAKLVKRYEHKKGEAIELLKGFVKETHGTPASAFRGKLGAIQAMEILEDLATVPVLRELADRESDGRIQRRAQETISNLFDAAKKPKELKEIRSELDDITKDNKSLRDRLNLLEKKDEAKSKQKKKGK